MIMRGKSEGLKRLTEHDSSSTPIQRYVAILLEEFMNLKPATEEAARILASWSATGRLWAEVRVVVTGYALRQDCIADIFGQHALVAVTKRKYTLVAPPFPEMLVALLATQRNH